MIRALRWGTGREAASSADAPPDRLPDAPAGAAPAIDRDLYWRIGTFLFDQALPPTPAYYLLAHVYIERSDPGVVAAVDAVISPGRRMSPAVADSILAGAGLCAGGVSTAQFERMAGEAEQRVDRVAGLVDRTRADARTFGAALEANAAGITAASVIDRPTATALLDLAGAMIASTRHAEERMRHTAAEIDELRVKLAAARADAETDALTGLPNRRAFDRRFDEARAAALQAGSALSLAIVDIDRFKDVNDEHGHDVGDRVLQLFARTLGEACRPHAVARRGGEEFALVFDGIGAEQAFALLDGAREAMAMRTLRVAETRRALGRLTFSAGVVAFDGAESCAALLRRADTLLYRAKQAGRNQLAI